ncbi:MAG: M50 family metallopeptidase [Patescibacteria group bacterium]|jgi:regulator of sigma E protease|nr:M50 family metallopeptidase [Patescibacteria group bacterium]
MTTLITFIIVFGLIVFVHELGHFTAAKIMKVGVKKFAFGFPPRLWSKKVGETEYAINLIPFGGYVKLEGEDEDTEEVDTIIFEQKPAKDEKNERAKNSKRSLLDLKPGGLLLIFSAGVVMNIILAIVILWGLFMTGFKPIELGQFSQKIYPGIDGTGGVKSTVVVTVDDVEKNTPAAKEGLKKGDKIIKIDGKRVYFSGEVIQVVQSKINQTGASVLLEIQRDGKISEKTLTTYKSKLKDRSGKDYEVNRIGIILETDGKLQAGPIIALKDAIISTWNIAKYTFIGILDLFGKLFTQFKLSENIAGPIGLVVVTDYFSHLGITAILQFIAILSISVALFNILPIPALDGGYIAFILAEVITRKKLSLKVKNVINLIGFGALITLMVVVTFRDFFTFEVGNYILKLFGR